MDEKIAQVLIKYRTDNKITQVGLAQLLGVAQSQVCKWEKGIHQPSKLRLESIKNKLITNE